MIFGGVNIKTGFIGAGKVGFSLGRYLVENGVEVTGYSSRSMESAREAALFTNTKVYSNLENLVDDSDILFLTVTDGIIKKVWNRIRALPIKGKIICHCSGSLSSSIFLGIDECEAYAYSVHPLYAINDKHTSYRNLHKAIFTIEGSGKYIKHMDEFIRRLGNKTQIIDTFSKTKYHAAAVMVSNQVVALAHIGISLLMSCGISETNARAMLESLMIGNVENIVNLGTREALTGPVERNDIETIKKHLESLSGRDLKIYVELSKVLLEIAKDKHTDENFIELEKELRK